MLKFSDLTLGDRFTLVGDDRYPLLTKISDQRARWHSFYSIENELSGQDSGNLEVVGPDEAVEFIPVVIR
ncbi:Group-specific protein [Pseudomonas zeae]